MQTAFLIILSLLGTLYAFWTKQFKTAAGFLIFAIAFTLTIPNMVSGFWVDVLMALSIIIFALGVFVIAWRKSAQGRSASGGKEIAKPEESEKPQEKTDENPKSK